MHSGAGFTGLRPRARSQPAGRLEGPWLAWHQAETGSRRFSPRQPSLALRHRFPRFESAMTYTFKLARRIARLRAPLLAITLLVALAEIGRASRRERGERAVVGGAID